MKGIFFLFLCALLPGCKDRSPPQKEQPVAPEPAAEIPPLAMEHDAKPAEPQPTPITELPFVLFEAATGNGRVASWRHDNQLIVIRTLATRHPDGKLYRVEVVADARDDREQQELSVCSDLRVDAAGRVELSLRGDYLHLLCINPPLNDEPGWTEAVRLRFRPETGELHEANRYSGEGIVDPDTLDLDEADIVDDPH